MTSSLWDTVVLTLDLDWAPDEIVADTLELLDERGLQATIFATHATKLDFGSHEIALHPNIQNATEVEGALEALRRHYPAARGVRFHRLVSSSPIQLALSKAGIEYSSNYMMERCAGLQPAAYLGLCELPIYFMDNLNLWHHGGDSESLLASSLRLSDEAGLKVLAFHPHNVFLNLDCIERQERAKACWKSVYGLRQLRNTEARGCRDLLIEILDQIVDERIPTATAGAVADRWRNTRD